MGCIFKEITVGRMDGKEKGQEREEKHCLLHHLCSKGNCTDELYSLNTKL
jgi:hypothetical protein